MDGSVRLYVLHTRGEKRIIHEHEEGDTHPLKPLSELDEVVELGVQHLIGGIGGGERWQR